jgi:LysR family transcriptional regulator, nitrogen assimilation regulatory protein
MTLRQLSYLVRVIETGSMTRAAEQLRVAQPALGTQIRLLEQELGTPLLLRHSRGIAPTAAGALLLERAREILSLVERTGRDVVALAGAAAETIRLGITPSLMQIVGPEIALRARAGLPGVTLRVTEEMSHRLAQALQAGELDMALAYEVPDRTGLRRLALYQEDLVLVARPGPEDGAPVMLAEALAQELAMPEPGDSVRDLVARSAADLGLPLTIAHEMRSIGGIRSLIERGEAAGILPYGTVLDAVQAGRLGMRPVVAPVLRRTLHLAVQGPPGRLRAEAALTAILRDALGLLAEAMGPLGHRLDGATGG